MKITSVSYRALRTGRGYNNAAVEAHATIDPDEDPIKAVEELKFWVEKRLDASLELDDAYADLASVRGRVETAQRELERLRDQSQTIRDHSELKRQIAAGHEVLKKFDKLVELAREHGLSNAADLLDLAIDGVPF